MIGGVKHNALDLGLLSKKSLGYADLPLTAEGP